MSSMPLDQFAPEMARALGIRGQQKRSFMVGSVTMGHELRVETGLEMLIARVLDIDPRTKGIRPQPFTLRLDLLEVFPSKEQALGAEPAVPPREERDHPDDVYIYTPDFLVEGSTGREVVLEGKPEAELQRIPETVEQWKAALCKVGYAFDCVTDAQVCFPGLAYNAAGIRDALHHLQINARPTELDQLSRVVGGECSPFQLGQLLAHFSSAVIYMAIATGVLACDLRAGVLAPSTLVRPAGGDLSHLQLLPLEMI
jgi:hypothetical protein